MSDPGQRRHPDVHDAELLALHPVTEVIRPALRGMNHLLAFPLSLLALAGLVWWAQDGRDELAAFVFGASVCAVLGTSGLYHRLTWGPRAALWARRVDHSMIFVCMAGIYTGMWVAVLQGRPLADTLLYVAWIGCAGGVVFKLFWIDAPKWLGTGTYLALGAMGLLAIPEMAAAVGTAAVVVILLSGLVLAAGAAIYALEWPDPFPRVFGYHELFHGLVTVGFALQYAAWLRWLLPR